MASPRVDSVVSELVQLHGAWVRPQKGVCDCCSVHSGGFWSERTPRRRVRPQEVFEGDWIGNVDSKRTAARSRPACLATPAYVALVEAAWASNVGAGHMGILVSCGSGTLGASPDHCIDGLGVVIIVRSLLARLISFTLARCPLGGM